MTDKAQTQIKSGAQWRPLKGNLRISSPLRANFIFPHKVGIGEVESIYSSYI